MSNGGTTVNVRFSGGAYVARGGGRTASCTRDGDTAVKELARKLGWNRYIVGDIQALELNHTRLTLRPELKR